MNAAIATTCGMLRRALWNRDALVIIASSIIVALVSRESTFSPLYLSAVMFGTVCVLLLPETNLMRHFAVIAACLACMSIGFEIAMATRILNDYPVCDGPAPVRAEMAPPTPHVACFDPAMGKIR